MKSPPTKRRARAGANGDIADESEACLNSDRQAGKRLIKETCARLLEEFEFKPTLTSKTYANVIAAGFNRVTLPAAFALTQLALEFQPINVRGLLYRAVCAGVFQDTSDKFKVQTERIILKLRREGIIPYSWIVDSTRRRLKPSSWSGLADFAETAVRAYRLDLWSRQSNYIEFFVEKDAMAGIIEPVTAEYDVYLNVIRGQASETFAWAIGEHWKEITKPIYAYYLGDHDPAGLSIEACLRSKLAAFSGQQFYWERLAITPDDFADEELLGFPVKKITNKGVELAPGSWQPYLAKYGDRCVEVDAISPNEIRERIRRTIESHIDQYDWRALQRTEKAEKHSLEEILGGFRK